jgi:hypothetical protein
MLTQGLLVRICTYKTTSRAAGPVLAPTVDGGFYLALKRA